MIRRPVVLADARMPLPAAALPDLSSAGLDAVTAAASVSAAGGDAEVFARALAAGLGQKPAASAEREHVMGLVAVAGWRAGVLGLRADALRRLPAMEGAVAAATLGIDAGQIAVFLDRQREDRFWWPRRAAERGYVLAVGGFRGLGGVWMRPPERVERLADDGAFALLVAGDWWRLDCDVWGARLTMIEEPERTVTDPGDGVSVVIGQDTHLAWVHVQERG